MGAVTRPVLYVAGPYTHPDPSHNVHQAGEIRNPINDKD